MLKRIGFIKMISVLLALLVPSAALADVRCDPLNNLYIKEYSKESAEIFWNTKPNEYKGYIIRLTYDRERSNGWQFKELFQNQNNRHSGSHYVRSFQTAVNHAIQGNRGTNNDIRNSTRDHYWVQPIKNNGTRCAPQEAFPRNNRAASNLDSILATVAPLTSKGKNPFKNLRCVTYSRTSAEVLWDNPLSGVTVNLQVAGNSSFYMGNDNFSRSKKVSVWRDGFKTEVTCPAH